MTALFCGFYSEAFGLRILFIVKIHRLYNKPGITRFG